MPKYRFSRDSLQDYYFDSDLQRVVSMKRGKPHLMAWSTDRSGRQYVALQGTYGKSIFHRLSIRQSLKDRSFKVVSHRNFRTVPKKVAAAFFPVDPKIVLNVPAPQPEQYVIAWTINYTSWHIDSSQVIWSDIGRAKIIAEREAKTHAGRQYRVLKICGTVETSGVTWS